VDTKQAIILAAAIIGVVQLAKTFVWGTTKERITAGIVLAASISMTYLVATSAWGNEQIVGGKQLGELGWSSLLLVGIILGAVASTGWEAFTTVRNVGFNQPKAVKPPVANEQVAMPPTGEKPMPDFTGDNVHVVPDDYTGPPDV
jgi:hypothetical protein